MMRKINNLQELKAERIRLRMELATAEDNLKDDLNWFKEEMNPVKVLGNIVSNAFVSKNNGGLVNNGVRFTIDAVVKNLILSKAGWITKLVVPFVMKNISSNFIAEKKPEIFSMLKNLIHQARKTTATHKPNNNHSQNHYDKSTVDEMDY